MNTRRLHMGFLDTASPCSSQMAIVCGLLSPCPGTTCCSPLPTAEVVLTQGILDCPAPWVAEMELGTQPHPKHSAMLRKENKMTHQTRRHKPFPLACSQFSQVLDLSNSGHHYHGIIQSESISLEKTSLII